MHLTGAEAEGLVDLELHVPAAEQPRARSPDCRAQVSPRQALLAAQHPLMLSPGLGGPPAPPGAGGGEVTGQPRP